MANRKSSWVVFVLATIVALLAAQPPTQAGERRCIGDDVAWNPPPSMSAPSLRCLACHDGSIGSMVGGSGHGLGGGGDNAGLHPVGVPYLDDPEERKRLRPRATLDPAIRLPNGNVECTSCHRKDSALPFLLVRSNQGSGLCLGCHDL